MSFADDVSSSDNAISHHSRDEERSLHSSELDLANPESKAVWGLRWLVFAVLLLCAMVVVSLTHFTITKIETDDFKATFEANAIKILQSLGSAVEQKISATDTFVVTMVGCRYLSCQSRRRCSTAIQFNFSPLRHASP